MNLFQSSAAQTYEAKQRVRAIRARVENFMVAGMSKRSLSTAEFGLIFARK
jgi:hypothetical protein